MTIELQRATSALKYRIVPGAQKWYNYTSSNRINSRSGARNALRPDTRKDEFLMQPHITPSQFAQENIEEWRDVPGYEGYYQVSSFGRVRSLDRFVSCRIRGQSAMRSCPGKTLSPDIKNPDGYHRLALKKSGKARMFTVHGLVALAFLGPRPDGNAIHHIDGDKQNNSPSNLAYVTGLQHSSIHCAGEKCWKAKLTLEQVRDIRDALSRKTMSTRQLSIKYGVTDSTISAIGKRRTWKE